jgi:hypothetical protein
MYGSNMHTERKDYRRRSGREVDDQQREPVRSSNAGPGSAVAHKTVPGNSFQPNARRLRARYQLAANGVDPILWMKAGTFNDLSTYWPRPTYSDRPPPLRLNPLLC